VTVNVEISAALQQTIFRHLESAYPNEGGGFLLGVISGETVLISESVPVQNVYAAEEQYHRYAMTPADWARLEDEADARGLTLVGYYHSHPDSPPLPSVFDRDHALPFFTYLITEVTAGQAVEMRAWRLHPDRTAFEAEKLAVSG
jgi:proteasome lid subunit RPN8/RPN11